MNLTDMEKTKMKIKELDEQLSLLRESWLTSVGAKKNRLFRMINKMLDDRIELMKERDKKL